MKKNRLFIFVMTALFATFIHAQEIANLTVVPTFSNTAPLSGNTFTLDLTLASQATGEANLISGAKLSFDLHPDIEILQLPQLLEGQYTLTQTGNTHVELVFNTFLPTGSTRGFLFLLKYKEGVSVHEVDKSVVNFTFTADDCVAGTATTTVNPQNLALPTIMSASTGGNSDVYHSLNIELKPEDCIGGLNHNNATVSVKLPATSTVSYIKFKGEILSPMPTPIIDGDFAIYNIPISLLKVCDATTPIEFFFDYGSVATGGRIVEVTYTATRENGDAVNETRTIDENGANNNPIPVVFTKSATDKLIRPYGANQKFNYNIVFNPIYAASNIVIIDNPITNESQFFDVNRFTKVEWNSTPSELNPSGIVKTKISYEYSDAPSTWIEVNSTPLVSGNSIDFSTTDAKYVTKFKIEFFDNDGNSTIQQYSGKVNITINAITTANISNTTYIVDNKLNNTMYVSGTVKSEVITNEAIQSSTELLTPRIEGYVDWNTHPLWYARNEVEVALPSSDYPWNVFGVTGAERPISNGIAGIKLTSNNTLKVGDEFWYNHYSILEKLGCKDYGFVFVVESPYLEVIDVAAGRGIGNSRADYPYEVFKTPEGYSVVMVKLNGNNIGSSTNSNNPFNLLDWWRNNYDQRQNIGLKLRVKPGAQGIYTISSTSGTTNFDQPFGNGFDAYNPGNVWGLIAKSGATEAKTGEYWCFASRNATVTVNNTLTLTPSKTASTDGVSFSPSVTVDNKTTDVDVYYKLHLENNTPGITIDTLKIIDALPLSGDQMVLNKNERKSNISLNNVSIHQILENGVDVTLPSTNYVFYTSTTATVDHNQIELANITNTTSVWTVLTGTSIPNGTKAIKVWKKNALSQGSEFDIILKATLPQSTASDVAWNSFGVGAKYKSGTQTINVATSEPTKSAVRGLSNTSIYSISGVVWNDYDKNGTHDASEPGIENIRVSLYDKDDNWWADCMTDQNGLYNFSNLEPGNWFLKIEPTGYLSPYFVGGVRTDCDFGRVGNLAVATLTITNGDRTNVDCGLYDNTYEQIEIMCGGESRTIALDFNTRPIGTAYWFTSYADASSAKSLSPENATEAKAMGANYTFTKNNTDAKEQLFLLFASDDNKRWISDKVHGVDIYLTPDTLIWNGSVNNDWNNGDNWTYPNTPNPWNGDKTYMVPRACTNVLISNSADNFPDLYLSQTNYAGSFKDAQCNNIHFEYLTVLARSSSLQYSRAFVKLDLKTNNWYSLAAPLQDMYSGDYAFERITPLVQMKVYNSPNPQSGAPAVIGDWSKTFNTDTVSLYSTMGYNARVGKAFYDATQFKSNPDEGLKDYATPILKENAIWNFPKEKLQFKHYSQSTNAYLPEFDQFLDGEKSRANIHRFTYERAMPYADATTSGGMSAKIVAEKKIPSDYIGNTVLVGNPFMSYVDFKFFYKENHESILPQFTVVYENANVNFSAVDENDNGDLTQLVGDEFIKPMQSFIVTLRENVKPASLLFYDLMSDLKRDSEEHSVINAPRDPNLAPRAVLDLTRNFDINVSRGEFSGSASVLIYPDADNNYLVGEDAQLITHQSLSNQLMYVFTETDGVYLSTNRLNMLPDTLKIGLKTSGSGSTVLRINKLYSASDEAIYFKDKLLNVVRPITSDAFSYTFTETGDQLNRFVIFSNKVPTSDRNTDFANGLTTFIFNNILNVVSKDDSDIQDVEVMDVTGRLLYKSNLVNAAVWQHAVDKINEVLIVKSRTQNGVYINKVINK